MSEFYERLARIEQENRIARIFKDRPADLHDYQGCVNDPSMQKGPSGEQRGVSKFFGTWPGEETDSQLLSALDEIRKPEAQPPLREDGQLPPLKINSLIDATEFCRRRDAGDFTGDWTIIASNLCQRERQLLAALAENESLKVQLSTVLARESATTARYDAKLEKMLELLREYRAMHNYSDIIEHQTDDGITLCSTCKAADLLLAGEEKV